MGACVLVCPVSGSTLDLVQRSVAEARLGGPLAAVARVGSDAEPVGVTDEVMLRADLKGAYPVLPGGIPVLLAPEILVGGSTSIAFDLTDARYAEAYGEMGHYDTQTAAAVRAGAYSAWLDGLAAATSEQLVGSFPADWARWLDAPYDCLAQWDCYRAMGNVDGKVVAQLGGSGLHAVKFLLAGARTAYLISPVFSELEYGQALADQVGVADRLIALAAVGEQLPLADGSLDALYSGGSLHHMQTELAGPEIARVLRSGGVFASAEPWRSSLYAVGVGLLGKRESGALCTPLTEERLSPIRATFGMAEVTHHGALTRYLTLALGKARVRLPLRSLKRIYEVDDRICAHIGALRRQGSSVSVVVRA